MGVKKVKNPRPLSGKKELSTVTLKVAKGSLKEKISKHVKHSLKEKISKHVKHSLKEKISKHAKSSPKEIISKDAKTSIQEETAILDKNNGVAKTKAKKFMGQKKKKRAAPLTKRERRALRLKGKKHSEVVVKLLPLWEVLRNDKTSKDTQHELIESILKLSEDKLFDLSQAHDTSRVLEDVVRLGGETHHRSVFEEIKPRLLLLAKSRYSRFVVLKLITYGTKEQRMEILKIISPHAARLMCNKYSAEVVELLYNDYASASQRAQLLQQLYGNQQVLGLREHNVTRLADALLIHPSKRDTILTNLNSLLVGLVSKGLGKYSIVQHLLVEYFVTSLPFLSPSTTVETEGDDAKKVKVDAGLEVSPPTEAPPTDELTTLLDAMIEAHLVPMLHTREGVRAALMALWAAPAKQRKALVRGLKTCVSSIACDEHGHLFLIGVLDTVDDIVLLEKTVIKELVEDLELMVIHPHARKVLLYALSPRDPRHFAPQLVTSLLWPGDANPYTKKPLSVRALELRAPQVGLLPALLKLAAERLLELFVGDVPAGYTNPFSDRGRLVLLFEMLSKSAASQLTLESVQSAYHRHSSSSSECSEPASSVFALSSEALEGLKHLRKAVIEQIVSTQLAPEFHPAIDVASCKVPKSEPHIRSALQTERRKLALRLANETELRKRKLTITPFTADLSAEKILKVGDVEKIEDERDTPSANMPFLERSEGQLFMRRLLQQEKSDRELTLGKTVMESVSPDNIRAWTKCNRSCFFLVNLFELNDNEISARLKLELAEVLNSIQSSSFPGAKVLLKHMIT